MFHHIKNPITEPIIAVKKINNIKLNTSKKLLTKNSIEEESIIEVKNGIKVIDIIVPKKISKGIFLSSNLRIKKIIEKLINKIILTSLTMKKLKEVKIR